MRKKVKKKRPREKKNLEQHIAIRRRVAFAKKRSPEENLLYCGKGDLTTLNKKKRSFTIEGRVKYYRGSAAEKEGHRGSKGENTCGRDFNSRLLGPPRVRKERQVSLVASW